MESQLEKNMKLRLGVMQVFTGTITNTMSLNSLYTNYGKGCLK